MFEATLEEAALLKKIVEATKELVTDASFDCNETGLEMQAMDSSHVALCYLVLNNTGFSHFRCDRKMSLGLNLTSLSKVLKCANNEDQLTLKAEEDTDTLNLQFENQKQDKIMQFDVKLMGIDAEQLGIPPTDYKCTISMESNEFQRIIRDLTVLGDTCDIACTKDGVTFSVQGDIGDAEMVLKHGGAGGVDSKDDDAVAIEMEEPVKLRFALRFLNNFTKASPLAKRVKLCMSPDVPLAVEYNMGEAGMVRYYLAPKMEEENM